MLYSAGKPFGTLYVTQGYTNNAHWTEWAAGEAYDFGSTKEQALDKLFYAYLEFSDKLSNLIGI